jgi:threonine dehydratase
VLNFDIIQSKVDKVLTVSESGIRDGMALIWRHFRMVIEPSSATVIAAISEYPEVFASQKVAAVISGGNVDLEQLPFKP